METSKKLHNNPAIEDMVRLPRTMIDRWLALPRSCQGYHDYARSCQAYHDLGKDAKINHVLDKGSMVANPFFL